MSNSSGTAKPDESKRELNEASHGQTGVEKWLDKVILIVTKMYLTQLVVVMLPILSYPKRMLCPSLTIFYLFQKGPFNVELNLSSYFLVKFLYLSKNGFRHRLI